jgi:hypothetical protein
MNTSSKRFWAALLTCSALLSSTLAAPAQRRGPDNRTLNEDENRTLRWDPPDVDAPLHSRGSSQPCVLSSVLEQAGARANALIANLQNFTAQERIEYQNLGHLFHLAESDVGTFDYTVTFEQHKENVEVQEGRTPRRGSHAFPAGIQDVGLPAIALLFLPEFQGDYEMSCEGATEWRHHPAWLVHFQQRDDKPVRTVSFSAKDGPRPAKLKGRAWIAQDSSNFGEIMHLETSLTEPMPAIGVRNWYLSIEYAPVQFRSQKVRVWLPRAADAYCDFGDHRTIIYHTFTNFLLFSVQTDQVIDKPKTP